MPKTNSPRKPRPAEDETPRAVIRHFAAGAFEVAGSIAQDAIFSTNKTNENRVETLKALQEAFGGKLVDQEGKGRGAGKTFVAWVLTDEERLKFFEAIHPHCLGRAAQVLSAINGLKTKLA